MDPKSLVPFLLFLHVMGAIIAFGPTYAYSIMGAAAGREPQHANFSARQVALIGRSLVYPLAIIQGHANIVLTLPSDFLITVIFMIRSKKRVCGW